ncbi:IS30 family transposase [Sporolactobacillus sp. CPB3-1]|uniref:IS30 family transposase n=1 Tax=Sporolactobacillus mangiferae TaxID=2940498 RepID=A0ABT0MDP4_9BACL|nr:IS30 family transposase [Sporolactobacillus mangiferae]MCL1632992.1 IS30 family transposase [Sporolactobacillus mangiferae]
MSHYHHLNPFERESILRNVTLGKSRRAIATLLGRSPATISRELKRNSQQDGTYSSVHAEENYHARRTGCHRQPLLAHQALCDQVQRLILDHQWSPEQIDRRMKHEHHAWHISYTTIYRGIERHLLDTPERRPGQRGLARHLRHRGKARHGQGYVERRGKIDFHPALDQRPLDAQERRTIGHWEADTVIGKPGSDCLVTLVDRRTRFLMAAKATRKTARYVTEQLIKLLNPLPEGQRRSVTPDRGKEFAWYARITETLGVPFYFPAPHAPWQRGSNENTNGLLREYFPKGYDLKQDSDVDVQHHVDELNHRPRKCLGWRTPFEAFYHRVLHLI